MREIWILINILLLLGLLGQILTITQKTNVADTLTIKCGYKLRETCPSTGMNWGRP